MSSPYGFTDILKMKFHRRLLLVIIYTSCILADSSPEDPTDGSILEELFVQRFGDNYTNFKGWYPIRDWYMETDEPKLRKFCTNAHSKAGKGAIAINVLVMRPRFICFEKYRPKRVDMVAYGVADPNAKNPDMLYWHTPEGKHWYITEGLQPDCVFYATIPNITLGVFKLIQYVCGIEIPH